jgi:hypothetical protein
LDGKGAAAAALAAETAVDCNELALPTPNWFPPAQRPPKEDSEDWGACESAAATSGPHPTSSGVIDLCAAPPVVGAAAGGMCSPPKRQVALEQVSPRDCSPSCARDLTPPLILDTSPVGSPSRSPTSDLSRWVLMKTLSHYSSRQKEQGMFWGLTDVFCKVFA